MTILGITGHRPNKLYGYDESHPGNSYIINEIHSKLKEINPTKVIIGMALGTDQWTARWCIKLEIPFVAALPMKNMDAKWPEKAQKMYHAIIKKAAEIWVVPNQEATLNEKMQLRNEYIVDNSDKMLAVFGGQTGGTYNCLVYAKKHNKKIDLINPGGLFE